jgi:hypothetical protein
LASASFRALRPRRRIIRVLSCLSILIVGLLALAASSPYRVRPLISYSHIEALTTSRDIRSLDLRTAYLPISVGFLQQERDANTKEQIWNPPTLPAHDLQQALVDAASTWEATDHYRQLQSTLSELSAPLHINKITAFALGSLTLKSQPSPINILQHALHLALGKLLVPAGQDLRWYAQDPQYTDPDKQALEAMGITVLDDPHVFLEVDSHSIVLSIGADVPVRQIITDISRPAVIIWDSQISAGRWYVSLALL